ncbi:MAG: ABC transporter permease [Termitinemataceae bacterium]|nr:MAG: ABC transporter permease [Termitinemataceae bacterium]
MTVSKWEKSKNSIFKHRWVMFVASRFIKNEKKSSTSTVLSVLGIGVGVMALTVIIAVMNGFQLGFIESILEISSYHVRINSFPLDNKALLGKITKISDFESAVQFKELKGILRTRNPMRLSEQSACVVRGLPPNVRALDEGMAGQLDFEAGSFDLNRERSILLGSEAASSMGLDIGDEVDFWTISSGAPLSELAASENSNFTVTGIFRSGYYEYDLSWAFIRLNEALILESGEGEAEKTCTLGIKLKNRWKVDRAEAELKQILAENSLALNLGSNVTTWRDYNKAFFGALRTEKLLMFVLVGLIFIVVALNIFQSQRRTVLERSEEIALMRSVGATSVSVRAVFMFDGIIIGAFGSGAGLAIGLGIAVHIREFFSGLESLVNFFIRLLSQFTGSYQDQYSIFSPKVFYIKDIPSRVIPHEVIMIFLFGFLSAVIASWVASKKVSGFKPAHILRYE